jgi:predicted dehydrogenase
MKVAVLGTGGNGRGKIKAMKEHCPDVTDIVGYDISEEALAGVKEKFPDVETSTGLDAVLADPAVQLVMVCSSNAAHKDLTVRSLEAGRPVLCEKPMANTMEEARVMVETAEKLGGWLQIGFECRYSKLYMKIKDWIDRGLLGNVVSTHTLYSCSEFHGKGSWRNLKSTGGSMFGEKLSHYVDLPRWFTGSTVTEAYSACAPNVVPYFEVRDNYHTSYKFDSGAVGHIGFYMNFAETFDGDPLQDLLDQQKEDGHALRIIVVGDKGAAAVSVFHRWYKRWEYGDSPKQMTSKLVEEGTWPTEDDHLWIHNTTDEVVDTVRRIRDKLPPMVPARDSLETTALCMAADISADEGRVVKLEELM